MDQALADRRYAATDLVELTQNAPLRPEPLLRAGLLFTPARVLPSTWRTAVASSVFGIGVVLAHSVACAQTDWRSSPATPTDPAGNQSATATASVTIAANAPTLRTKPAATIVLGATGTFTCTAVPGLSYQYTLDGGAWTTTSNSNRQSVPLSVLGNHTFRLRGTDSTGNHTSITTDAVTVILGTVDLTVFPARRAEPAAWRGRCRDDRDTERYECHETTCCFG